MSIDPTAAVEVWARMLCAADVHVNDGDHPTWRQLAALPGSTQDDYRKAARWLLPRLTAAQPAVLAILPAPADRLAELEAENAALRARLAAPERDRIVVLADGDPMTDALVDGRKIMLTALADAVLALTLETNRPAVLHAAADQVAAQQSWIADLLRKHADGAEAEQWQAPELTPEEAAEADRILEQRMAAAEAREAGIHACACGQPGCEHCDVDDEAGEGR